MGKFEKIFWATIALFAIIWGVLQYLAYQNSYKHTTKKESNISKPVLTQTIKTIIEVIDDNNTIKNNLNNPKTLSLLEMEFNNTLSDLNKTIDSKIDLAFKPIFVNIDTFLDFHYSVKGEYIELAASASGDIASVIKEKLFGDDIQEHFKEAQNAIGKDYLQMINSYLSRLNSQALKGVDSSINSELFAELDSDISDRMTIQEVKLGSIIGIKVIGVISAKLATKATGKALAKSSAKAGAKLASAGSAAASGTICGPFAWICSPIAATVAWFGSDAILVKGDEYLNREKLKAKIKQMLDRQKEALKESLIQSYTTKFTKDAKKIKEIYESKSVKKRIKRRVIERIYK